MSKVAIKSALDRVNEGRVALGYEPLNKMPKGILSDPTNCPVYNAFGEHNVFVSHGSLMIDSRNKARILAQTWGTQVFDAADAYGGPKGWKRVLEADDPGTYLRWTVILPEDLSSFIVKFDDRGYKSLISPDEDGL